MFLYRPRTDFPRNYVPFSTKTAYIKVLIIRIHLKGEEVLFVKFAGHDLEPIRKKKARSFRGKKHPQDQKADIQRISSRIPEKLERMEQVIVDTFGAEFGQDAYFKTAVPLDSAQPTVPTSAPGPDKQNTSGQLSAPEQDGRANGDGPQLANQSRRKKPVVTKEAKSDGNASAETQPPKLPDSVRRLRESFQDDEEAL